ncbi:hypothetical protein V8C35DRAFT_302793 [Trichoderma chlorosporum]
MFEDQHESPPTNQRPKTGVISDALNPAEGAYKEKSVPYRVPSGSRKITPLAKSLYDHPKAVGDVESKEMANEKYSPYSNAWPLVDTWDDVKGSYGNMRERAVYIETQERGTQTDTLGDEALSSMTSFTGRYGYQDMPSSIDGEALLQAWPFPGTDDINSRLQELEQILHMKTAEAAQLKLRIHLLEETSPASLHEELMEASEEIQKWREKAEAAERKARRFQRFTTRIRSIHSSLAMAEGSRQSGDDEMVSLEGRDAEGSYRACRVRFNKAFGSEAACTAGDGQSLVTEIQDGSRDEKSDEETPVSNGFGLTRRDLHGLDGVASPGMMDFGSAAVAMWVAAQEYLLMEEDDGDETCRDLLGITTSGSSSDLWEVADEVL